MEEKLKYHGIDEISHEVRAWQDGNAEFDYCVCGEYVVRDKDGSIKYVQSTYDSHGMEAHIVSRYSAFDEENFEQNDYVIEEYHSFKKTKRSAFKYYFDALVKLTDAKYDEVMAQLDDTRNYPNGRRFQGPEGSYYEWYSEEENKYLQIRECKGRTIYSVSEESFYLLKYMFGLYPHYFHGKTKTEKYIEEVTSLDEFPWDSPYPFLFIQYRGIAEIMNRHYDAGREYVNEELVNYDKEYIPICLRVYKQNEETGIQPAIFARIELVGPENIKRFVYSAKYLDSGHIQYVSGSESAPFQDSMNSIQSVPVVYDNKEVAIKSEWREYFSLLDNLRERFEAGEIKGKWRTGSIDKYGVGVCSKKTLEGYYVICSERITKEVFETTPKMIFNTDIKNIWIEDICKATSSEEAIKHWLKNQNADSYKVFDNVESVFLIKKRNDYFRIQAIKDKEPEYPSYVEMINRMKAEVGFC